MCYTSNSKSVKGVVVTKEINKLVGWWNVTCWKCYILQHDFFITIMFIKFMLFMFLDGKMCKKTNYKKSNPRIDKCMKSLINFLKKHYKIVASCCGHGKYPITIVVRFNDGYYEMLSYTKIPRIRNFYKRDKQGYYYIPETIK